MPIVRALVELVAPRPCPGCDYPLPSAADGFCGACLPLLEEAAPAYRPPAPRAAAFELGGPLAVAIQRIKYDGRTDFAPALGALLSAAASPFAGRVDAVVPIPLHPARLRRRGFNQSALLARPVARRLAVPLRTGALRRVRRTQPQVGLSAAARLDNVRGAFRARPGAAPRVLLVDDVRTTGATAEAASDALFAAGVSEVWSLALAHAPCARGLRSSDAGSR